MPCTNSSFKCLVEYLNCIFFKCTTTAGRLYVGPLERYEVSWRRMAYSRLLSLRGDRRETANDDSRRSRPAVDRSCRPKGGMNDQRSCIHAGGAHSPTCRCMRCSLPFLSSLFFLYSINIK